MRIAVPTTEILATFGDASTIKEWKRDGSIRANPAIITGTYDASKDKFYWPKPYASWTLDSNDQWVPPVTRPTDKSKHWCWDEAAYQADNTKGWVEVTDVPPTIPGNTNG